jgi:chitinase
VSVLTATLIFYAFLTHCTPSPVSALSSGPETGKIIVYYQGYQNTSIASLDGSKFTHLIYAFGTIDPATFILRPHDQYQDIEQVFDQADRECTCCAKGKYYEMYKLRKRYPHLKILLSMGGARHSKPFSMMGGSPDKIRTFVTSAVKLMKNYGFDGLDIDWFVISFVMWR